MYSTPDISLVIATYNKPENLRLVLAAVGRQTFSNFEVIAADDGSGPRVRQVITESRKLYRFPIVHLWHPDCGWRKNTMLNNAIRIARSAYLVFIDGDCLPTRRFLQDHWEERQNGRVLFGRRVETSRRWSSELSLQKVQSGEFEKLGWREFADAFSRNALRLEDGIRMPNQLVRRLLLRTTRGMLGSNFSVSRPDLVRINGFDELYRGPGCGEDSDIQYRLSLMGVTGKSLRNLAIQFHIWHPRTEVSEMCLQRFQFVKTTTVARCSDGLEKLIAIRGEEQGQGGVLPQCPFGPDARQGIQ